MIRVLHVISSLGGGGVEHMLYSYYLNIDRNKVHFDFVVHGSAIEILEAKVQSLGAKVFHVTPKKVSIKRNILEIDKIIRSGNYDVVHCHQNFSNFTTLFLAKKNHVPVRISHSHGCKKTKSINELVKMQVLRLLNKANANYFFSCGIEAAKWLHGQSCFQNGKNIIMNNAIDLSVFSFDIGIREKYRKRFKIEDKVVLLHVGRFSNEKNHLFLLDIIQKLSLCNRQYVLLLVGNGAEEEAVKMYAQKKHIVDKVLFLGVRNDIAEIMNAADIFLLPSKHEGFGITLIEAQATGLQVFASNNVTKETMLTDLIEYLPIENTNIWIEKILAVKNTFRESRKEDIKASGYSVDMQAIKYENWLENVCNKDIVK